MSCTKKILFLLIFLLSVIGNCSLEARTVKGYVYSVDDIGTMLPLAGASVQVTGTSRGTSADAEGFFLLDVSDADTNHYLSASYFGYASDSLRIADITEETIEFILSEGVLLQEALITHRQAGTTFSMLSAQKTELITEKGLMKMACCNLSESFENSATVSVGFTDAVSGAKQVQLLGLSGIYCQLMDENVPTLRGLASTYGWSYTPGAWLESVQISKGASSVINGYESMTGQINTEHKKPNTAEPLFVNLYVDDAKRVEANITSAGKVASKLWGSILAHGSLEQEAHDGNNDTFMDMPKTKLINLYNRWFYLDDERGVQSRLGIKFLAEERVGGQDPDWLEATGVRLYETNITNKNFTAYNKTGVAVGDKEGQSVGIITSYTYHDQSSTFGDRNFAGIQNSFYSNAVFNSNFAPSHKYAVGLSFVYDNYKTHYEDYLYDVSPRRTELNKEEVVPGAFAEYTYTYNNKVTFIAGIRGDRNSRYGWLVTPRTNIRYNLSDQVVFRVSAGRGFRSPNAIAENIGFLASSRKINTESINQLDIEKAWNYGANATVNIPIWGGKKATLSLDYFRTDFQNQTVVDIERDRHQVFFYDHAGDSHADAWQVDLSLSPFEGFEVFSAFRYNKTSVSYQDGNKRYSMEKPLVSRYRGLLNLSYATKERRWVFDVTGQLNGPARIPGMDGYDSDEHFSEAYPVFFGQITRNSSLFDVYLGVENLLDERQKNPILGWDDPFGQNFDSSLIWGPLMGRKIYLGIRFRIQPN